MMDIQTLSYLVLENCRISDARHAGIYSLCGLAMRLRDLYKWEHGLDPWKEGEPADVLTWIGERENHWETLTEASFHPIVVNGSAFDPFDTQAINARINPEGLFYGAGYAFSLKPSFLLARIEKTGNRAGRRILYLGQEYARDLLTLPGFHQDDRIVVRRAATCLFLWDEILYISNSSKPALDFALRACGIEHGKVESIRENLSKLVDLYAGIIVNHELGELEDQVFPKWIWQDMISAYPHSAIEQLVRTLKDMLADTAEKGVLPQIIHTRQEAALGLYVAFGSSLRAALFPELGQTLQAFQRHAQWDVIMQACRSGRETARQYTDEILSIYEEGRRANDLEGAARQILSGMKARRLI